MLRHVVNFGLLFSFVTLMVSGAMSFVRPFSLPTTRVHIVFGLITALLVALHLGSRLSYFKNQIGGNGRSVSRSLMIGILIGWGLLVAAAVGNWWPARGLIGQSYEVRHRQEIVRVSPRVGYRDGEKGRVVSRKGEERSLSILVRLRENLGENPAIAVWAETTGGAMIETLFLDDSLAYSDHPEWGGETVARDRILPIWRHRYTMISGVDPDGVVDAYAGPTQAHSFSLDDYLSLESEKEFVLCVEVNAAHDGNESFPDELVGQPSLLYTTYVSPDSRHVLLELTGHGGTSEDAGQIRYDLDGVTSARSLVDLILATIEEE